MTGRKRWFDIALAIVALILLSGPVLVLMLVLLAVQGRPLFHVSERMRSVEQPFWLWKFRSMTVVAQDAGVSGADKTARITKPGWFLRRTRLDEVPQLWNILRGDMSFVGPRPPLRVYVERFPMLYHQVLRSRPGITGLATVTFRRHEERLLATCRTRLETDAVYARRCVHRKARLDLIYQRRCGFWLDLVLLGQTLGQLIGLRKATK